MTITHPILDYLNDSAALTAKKMQAFGSWLQDNASAIAKMDLAYITVSDSEDIARCNLFDPASFKLLKVGAPIFTTTGIKSNGPANYWDTGFIPSKHAKKATLTDAEIGVFVLSNEAELNHMSPFEVGNDRLVIKALEVNPNGGPTQMAARINAKAIFKSAKGVETTAVGLTSAVTNGTTVTLFKNGVQMATDQITAIGLGTLSITIGAVPSTTDKQFSNRRIGFVYYGKGLTTQERITLHDTTCDLLEAFGAYDPATGIGPAYVGDPFAPAISTAWDLSYAGKALDLTPYKITFEDNFNSIATVGPDSGAGPWYSPVHATYGSANFVPPTAKVNPFGMADDGTLRIRMEKIGTSWQSSTMQTMNTAGAGFSQKFGYFEAKLKMPMVLGLWAGLWLYSDDIYKTKTNTRTEIDVIEYYGLDSKSQHTTVHLRPAEIYRSGQVAEHWALGCITKHPTLADGGWHTHGCEVLPDWTIIYLDGIETKRIKTLPEMMVPLYAIVSLAMFDAHVNTATSPVDMGVDYVRVYAKA